RPAGPQPGDDERDARGPVELDGGPDDVAEAAETVVRTAVEFDRAGVAAVCIEDNLFPKRNSLYQGRSKRELIATREQARRLKAAVEAKDSEAFVVISRVEALIAGHG